MNLTAAQFGLTLLLSLTALSALAWGLVLNRKSQGIASFPLPPGREAPWGLSDLFIVAAFWLASMLATAYVAERVFQIGPTAEPRLSTEIVVAPEATPGQTSPSRTPPPALFLVSAAFSLLASGAALVYLHGRFGSSVQRVLGLTAWRQHLGYGLLGFILAMPPVIWLMSVLIQLMKYEHPTLSALADSPSPLGIAAVWLAAGFVAPLSEEFFFRGVLQSWLFRCRWRDTPDHRWSVLYGERRREGDEASVVVAGESRSRPWLPIVCTSLLFAAMHAGQGPAPIALFFYSIALGWVGYRTGSLIPCIAMHLLLNVYSLMLATYAALETQG